MPWLGVGRLLSVRRELGDLGGRLNGRRAV